MSTTLLALMIMVPSCGLFLVALAMDIVNAKQEPKSESDAFVKWLKKPLGPMIEPDRQWELDTSVFDGIAHDGGLFARRRDYLQDDLSIEEYERSLDKLVLMHGQGEWKEVALATHEHEWVDDRETLLMMGEGRYRHVKCEMCGKRDIQIKGE